MTSWVRGRLARTILIWTICIAVLAVVLATQAFSTLNAVGQLCFDDYPNTPCPTIADPALVELTLALVGLLLLWLLGMAVALVGRERVQRRDRAAQK